MLKYEILHFKNQVVENTSSSNTFAEKQLDLVLYHITLIDR